MNGEGQSQAGDFFLPFDWLAFPFQSPGTQGSKFNIPDANRFIANSNTPLCRKVLNISVTEVKSMIELARISDDIRW